MLPPDLIKKIKRLHIKTGRMVDTVMAGQYRSIFRGAGIEFEEVREYVPGDDVKSIDWRVTARLGRPHVKRFREEREQVVMLLVDMSASTRFGTTGRHKVDTAAEAASLLAFNAIRNNDKVGLLLFTDRVEKYIPPQKGNAHVWRVIHDIFAFEAQHKGTDIEAAVDYLASVCRKRTVSFLISDFLMDSDLTRLRRVTVRHELIAVMVTDPGAHRLPAGGIMTLEDLESGRRVLVDASRKRLRQHFSSSILDRRRQSLDQLKRSSIDCIPIATDSDAADMLTRYFLSKGKRRR